MKRFERILLKLIIVQFIFLLISQILLLNSTISPYITRMVDYEGVTNSNFTKILETFQQK